MTERAISWAIGGVLVAWPAIAIALWFLLSSPLQRYVAVVVVVAIAVCVLVWLGGLEARVNG